MRKHIKMISLLMAIILITSTLAACNVNVTGNVASDAMEESSGDVLQNGEESSQEAAQVTEESFADDENDADLVDENASGEITIVYTNDVHSYIDNIVKDGDGNVVGDGLRFSKIAAMVADLKAEGKNVILADAGDEVQGAVYGAMDEGASIIKIMNACGYDVAAPGNHDFDYGVWGFLRNADAANFTYVSCNFHSTITKEEVLPPTKVFEFGDKKVAIVGVTTPSTITSSTPAYFQNENGEFIYTVDGVKNPEDLYVSVQNAIDSVRDDVDYVIGLGHVGIAADDKKNGTSSEDIIANVSGLDAFIDGHSHSTVEGQPIKDKEGKEVLLTQTGSYLSAVGLMTISEDGSISTKLITEYEREDEKVAEIEQKWIEDVNNQLGEKIANLDFTLYTNNPDNNNQRFIRASEMNLGDFVADSIYWYFNDKLDIDCDIAIVNGGGIRAQIENGDVTYLTAKSVEPFGNMICLISASGQQIIDALEMGVGVVGGWNEEWNSPAESGGFLHVAGLSFTVDASVESSIVTDDNGMFESVAGDYRVKNVKVYNKTTGTYEDIEPDKKYQLGGINYLLRNGGNGMSMFDDDELSVDYVGQDYVILSEYFKSFAQDGGMPEISTANSPLSTYEGYLLDYEEAYGSGRIEILNVNYPE